MDLTEEKMVFGIGTSTVILGAWILTHFFPSLLPTFSTLTGGLIGVYTIFAGGNIANKWVEGRPGLGDKAQ